MMLSSPRQTRNTILLTLVLQDNCARAVSGTYRGTATVAAHAADCSSFLATTVTPATSTSYVTATVAPVTQTTTDATLIIDVTTTVSTILGGTTNVEVYNKRGVPTTSAGKSVPSYASACSGAVRFSSACLCMGISPITYTATAPTTTVTVTPAPTTVFVEATATVTAVDAVTASSPAYIDQIPCGKTVTGADGFRITVVCEQQPASAPYQTLTTYQNLDWDQCISRADANSQCTSFEFDINSLTCTLYRDSSPSAFSNLAAASGKVFGYFPQ